MTGPGVILFDLDGCLVDSTAAITGAINHALAAVGVPARSASDLTRYIGPPLIESFGVLLADAGADPGRASACIDAYRERYRTSAVDGTHVIAGVPDALRRLGQRFRLGVVTSKPLVFAIPILERLGLRRWFVAVHGPDAGYHVEPKAVTLARALVDVVGDGDTLTSAIVGDRSHDIIAGRACGIATVGVTWGAGDRAELLDAGADHVVDRPADLVDVFERAWTGEVTGGS